MKNVANVVFPCSNEDQVRIPSRLRYIYDWLLEIYVFFTCVLHAGRYVYATMYCAEAVHHFMLQETTLLQGPMVGSHNRPMVGDQHPAGKTGHVIMMQNELQENASLSLSLTIWPPPPPPCPMPARPPPPPPIWCMVKPPPPAKPPAPPPPYPEASFMGSFPE